MSGRADNENKTKRIFVPEERKRIVEIIDEGFEVLFQDLLNFLGLNRWLVAWQTIKLTIANPVQNRNGAIDMSLISGRWSGHTGWQPKIRFQLRFTFYIAE